MKNRECKKCGDEINITVFGMSDDVCWGCTSEGEKEDVLDKNIEHKKRKQYKIDEDRIMF